MQPGKLVGPGGLVTAGGDWQPHAAAAQGGGKSVRSTSATVDTDYDRSFSAVAAGALSIRMRISITNPNDFVGFVLREGGSGGTGQIFCRFGPTGNIEVFNGDSDVYESVGTAYSANTWYTIEVEWNDAAQADQFRARVDGGAWYGFGTPTLKVAADTYTNLDTLELDDSATNAHTAWFDDVTFSGGPTANDNFESYTLTNDLNGGAGGSGWSDNWADVGGGAMTIESTP